LLRHRATVIGGPWPLLAFFGAAVPRNRFATMPQEVLPDTHAFVGTGLWMAFFLNRTVDWVGRLISDDHSASSLTATCSVEDSDKA
jgi:hypothetical protein